MKINAFQIYLVGVIDNLGCLFMLVGCLCMAAALISAGVFVCMLADGPDGHREALERLRGVIRYTAPTALLCMVLLCLIPTSKTLAAMYVLPPLVNNDVVQKDIPEIIRLKLANWIDDLRAGGGQDKLPDGKEVRDGNRQ